MAKVRKVLWKAKFLLGHRNGPQFEFAKQPRLAQNFSLMPRTPGRTDWSLGTISSYGGTRRAKQGLNSATTITGILAD